MVAAPVAGTVLGALRIVMIAPALERFFEDRHVNYRVLAHPASITAQEVAHAAHVPGRRFAKTILLRVRGEANGYVLAALPATETVDLPRLGSAIGQPVELASEKELAALFPRFEVGAAPPIGELASDPLPVVADACLIEGGEVAFNGGNHTDLVVMPWSEYARVVSPRVIDYGRPRREEAASLWTE